LVVSGELYGPPPRFDTDMGQFDEIDTRGLSKRRIDAAVAAVMAHDRAAALVGAARDSIYI
jgi:hypothetical protein